MSGYGNNNNSNNNYRNPQQSNPGLMYPHQQGNNPNPNTFNSPRGFSVATAQGFQQSIPQNNYPQNQSMQMNQNQNVHHQQNYPPSQQQHFAQARPQVQAQVQQLYQARPQQNQVQQQVYQQAQQQPRPQSVGNFPQQFHQPQHQQQQQQSPPQQQQQQQQLQVPRGFQNPSNAANSGNNPSEWERFFQQSNTNVLNTSEPRASFPRGAVQSQYNVQQQQQQLQPQQLPHQQNMIGINQSLDNSFRSNIQQQQIQQSQTDLSPQLQSAHPGSFIPRGPRSLAPRGRGGPRGSSSYDPNSAGRGFSGRAPRGFPNQDNARFSDFGNPNHAEYDPYQVNNDPSQGNQYEPSLNTRAAGNFQQFQGQQGFQPQQGNQNWQSKQENYNVNNQVSNSAIPNTFVRNNQFDSNNQSFVNQNNLQQQQQAQGSYGGNLGQGNTRAPVGKWSSQFENPLGFNGNSLNNNNSLISNSGNATMNNIANYPTNNAIMTQQQHQTPLQQAPMSTAMKIMQTVAPRHARPNLVASSSFPSSTYDNPRPSFRKSSFPRGDTTIGRKRERSRTRSRSPLNRSRSPSSTDNRPPRGRGRGRGSFARDISPASSTSRPIKKSNTTRSPPRSTLGNRANSPTGASSTSTAMNKIDAAHLNPHELVEDLHLPAVLKNLQSLSMLDIISKFPKLYIPADFTDLKIDWTSISYATTYDFFFNISTGAPIVFENTPSTLKAEEEAAAPAGSEPPQGNDGATGTGKFFSDILEPSKFSYVSSNTVNNVISEIPLFHDRFINTEKPIKFNAKVLVCCGLKDPETERVDHNYCRKLRMLCGRRKGSILLLGTCWNAELDGGDPLTDRSCLLNTARRALLAQSLLDIARGDPNQNLVKLCEINYHRPKEEIKGRVYPEQEEITAIYVFSIQKNLIEQLSREDFEDDWTVFSSRAKGDFVGPMLSRTINEYYEKWAEHKSKLTPTIPDGDETSEPQNNESSPKQELVEATEEGKTTTSEVANKDNDLKTEEKKLEKPDSPAVLLCPMPLPAHIANDPSKKQDALSLRMMPLSTILSYTPDDCSERIFEASISAEILKSCISLNNANIIVDFIISMNGALSSLADQRIVAAVKRLKELNTATRAKVVAAAAVTAPNAENKQSEGKPDPATPTKGKLVEGESDPAPSSSSKVSPGAEGVIRDGDDANENADNSEPFVIEEVRENDLLLEEVGMETTATETAGPTDEIVGTSSNETKEPVDEEEELNVTDEEARVWRRRFVAACRWFDMKQERYLKAELLQLIFYVSQRNVSRADAVSSVEDVCGDNNDKLKYETCI